MENIGVFGGTFDPPHLGHLILAAEAREQMALDRLLWVLTPSPPHKQGRPLSPIEQRRELVNAAIQGDPYFELSTVDLDRPPPHFAVDTMALLKQQYPTAQLSYILGSDSLRDLPSNWHEPTRFVLECAQLVVLRRPGDAIDLPKLEKLLPGITPKLFWVETPLLEISSVEIRKRIASGRQYRYFLPPAVYELIRQREYYR